MFPAHMLRRAALVLAVLPGLCAGGRLVRAATPDPVLPAGVEAMWDLNLAYHETTPTRERICLNGLWQWQPANALDAPPPAGAWGYFKVPGCWPGITDYLEKDSQKVYPHPAWAGRSLPEITAAWYQRTFEVPAGWSGRRLALRVEYLNSYTAVFVDGRRAGEIQFPGGELDLPACPPGVTHTLALLVVAMPLQGVMLSYTDSASARQVRGAVPRRGRVRRGIRLHEDALSYHLRAKWRPWLLLTLQVGLDCMARCPLARRESHYRVGPSADVGQALGRSPTGCSETG